MQSEADALVSISLLTSKRPTLVCSLIMRPNSHSGPVPGSAAAPFERLTSCFFSKGLVPSEGVARLNCCGCFRTVSSNCKVVVEEQAWPLLSISVAPFGRFAALFRSHQSSSKGFAFLYSRPLLVLGFRHQREHGLQVKHSSSGCNRKGPSLLRRAHRPPRGGWS